MVDSEQGERASFNIFQPATYKQVVKRKNGVELIKGDEKILVVDDEPVVRKISRELLETLGYTVRLAENGGNAIKIYRKQRNKIDLILLDMLMPDLSGKDTFIELKKIYPDVKVILVSGFSRNDRVDEILKEGVLGFLQKPFRLNELSKTIAKVLKK